MLENEREIIRNKNSEYIGKTEEKVTLFVKLCRKYAKKLHNMIFLMNKLELSGSAALTENKEHLVKDISLTIEKFAKTINNPHLVSSLLDIESNYHRYEFEEEKEYDGYANDTGLVDVVKKLEYQIARLQEQNDQLANKHNNV